LTLHRSLSATRRRRTKASLFGALPQVVSRRSLLTPFCLGGPLAQQRIMRRGGRFVAPTAHRSSLIGTCSEYPAGRDPQRETQSAQIHGERTQERRRQIPREGLVLAEATSSCGPFARRSSAPWPCSASNRVKPIICCVVCTVTFIQVNLRIFTPVSRGRSGDCARVHVDETLQCNTRMALATNTPVNASPPWQHHFVVERMLRS